jgi:hypothetical protein
MRMMKPDWRPVFGDKSRTLARSPGILQRSRRILREAGALIVRCLQRVGAPGARASRNGDHRSVRRAYGGERRRARGATPPTRRWATHGREATPSWQAKAQSQFGRRGSERPAANGFPRGQPSEAAVAELLRQHAFRIAHSADPVDALAGVIDLVIDSNADPYHLIGVLAEGAVQTLSRRISSERRRDTAMALVQLMLDRLQFGRMD